MKKSPIWKDIEFNSDAPELDYTLKDVARNQIVHRGYSMRMPDRTGITVSINTRVEEYLDPDFAEDIDNVHNDVVSQPNAFKEYLLQSGDTTLETFDFLYDWSYEDNWTGQTNYYMSTAINGRLDPRMKIMNTFYNTGNTSYQWAIDYKTFANVSPTSLRYVYSGGTEVVNISSNDCWQITSKPDWITASVTAGCGNYSSITMTEVGFTASENPYASGRTGEIIITYSEGTTKIKVSQDYQIIFSVTPTSLHFNRLGNNWQNLYVTSNGDWSITFPSWIQSGRTYNYSYDATLSFTASTNSILPPTVRTGEILLRMQDRAISVSVDQEEYQPYIRISPTAATSYYNGSHIVNFTVTAQTSWYLDSHPDWLCCISGTTSGGSGTYRFSAQPSFFDGYSATGDVVVKTIYGASATSVVTREAIPMPLSVSPTSLSFVNSGGTKVVNVTSNWGFNISGDTELDWITVKKSGIAPNQTVIFTANFNPYSSPRNGVVTIYNPQYAVDVSFYQEESDPSQFWIVCTYDIPNSGNTLVLSNALTTGSTGMKTMKNIMRVDGVDVPLAKYYNFSTPGQHIVKFQVSGETGPIGYQVWSGNTNLRSVEIAQNVTGTYPNVFKDCTNLTAVTFAKPTVFSTLGMNAFDGTGIYNFVAPTTLKRIQGNAFQHTANLTAVTLNDGLESIGNNVFVNSALPVLYIPNSVTEVDDFAFNTMRNLTGVTIGSGVTTLCDSMFMDCTSLSSITIPSTVRQIDTGAFIGCTALTEIRAIGATPAIINAQSFYKIATGGTLHHQGRADYSTWMSDNPYCLGYYGWTAVGDL